MFRRVRLKLNWFHCSVMTEHVTWQKNIHISNMENKIEKNKQLTILPLIAEFNTYY